MLLNMKSNHVEYYWEDICEQQVKSIYDHYYEWYSTWPSISDMDPIENINSCIQYLIDETNALSKPITYEIINKPDNNPIFFDIAGYAIFAIDNLENYSYIDWYYISSILINKQKDYGTANITKFGLAGIVVRLSDKVSRLINILSKNNFDMKLAINSNSVSGETLLDTLIDIVGYCTVALMLIDEDPVYKNKFLFPMKTAKEIV